MCIYTYLCMYIYIFVCVCIYIHIYVCMYAYIYTHIHISAQSFLKRYGDFRINPYWLMRCIFFIPQSHLLPALPHLVSGLPSSPALLHTGVTLLKYSSREGCSLTQLPAQSWLNVLFPVRIISPVVSKLPREKEQRSGVYRMSVFKVTLCVTLFFFFF